MGNGENNGKSRRRRNNRQKKHKRLRRSKHQEDPGPALGDTTKSTSSGTSPEHTHSEQEHGVSDPEEVKSGERDNIEENSVCLTCVKLAAESRRHKHRLNNDLLNCLLCTRVAEELIEHDKIHVSKEHSVCPECGVIFPNRSQLKDHFQNAHAGTNMARCLYRRRKFCKKFKVAKRKEVQQSLEGLDAGTELSSARPPLLVCVPHMKGDAFRQQLPKFREDLEARPDLLASAQLLTCKTVACPKCLKQLETQQGLYHHLLMEHVDKGEAVDCPWCPPYLATFSDELTLSYHVKDKHQEIDSFYYRTPPDDYIPDEYEKGEQPEPVECILCLKKFQKPLLLFEHIRLCHKLVHTGQFVYCPFCLPRQLMYSTNQGLWYHVKDTHPEFANTGGPEKKTEEKGETAGFVPVLQEETVTSTISSDEQERPSTSTDGQTSFYQSLSGENTLTSSEVLLLSQQSAQPVATALAGHFTADPGTELSSARPISPPLLVHAPHMQEVDPFRKQLSKFLDELEAHPELLVSAPLLTCETFACPLCPKQLETQQGLHHHLLMEHVEKEAAENCP